MTRQIAEQLEFLIADMNETDKQELVERLTRSMQTGGNDAAAGSADSTDEWMSRLQAWASSHPQRAHVDDGRDGIYSGRGS